LVFIFTLEHAIRNVQENQKRLALNGTHQLLLCAGENKLSDENINTIEKNMKNLFLACREVGIDVNAGKTKCIFMLYL
jgi:hypothetical protein